MMSFAGSSPAPTASRPGWPRHAIVAGPGLIIAALLWTIRNNFPFDDTFITFRYAYNLAHGYGIVWNPGGPHTEGYTNFLYVLLLAPFSWVGWDLVAVSQVVNVAAVIVTASAIYRLVAAGFSLRRGGGNALPDSTSQSEPRSLKAAATLAIALFYLDPFTWFNAFSGMETVLFAMFATLALCSAGPLGPTSSSSPDLKVRRYTPYLFATLAALTRPEGAMLGGIILAVSVAKDIRNSKFEIRNVLLYFVLPLALYAIWKYFYFGSLLPNSFYVKVAQAGQHLPGRGAMRIYYTGVWYLALGAIFVIVQQWKNPRIRTIAFWIFGLTLVYFFSVLIQNYYDRFMFPVEVCLIILAAAWYPQIRLFGWKLGASMILLVAFHVFFTMTQRNAWNTLTAPSMENAYAPLERTLVSIPHHEQITLCWSDAGYLPYYTHMQHIDPVGLNTTAIARAKSWQEVNCIIAKAKPEIIFVPYYTNSNEVFHDAHGLIAKGYPTLMQEPELASYKQLSVYHYPVYDIRIFADTLGAHYRDITAAFQTR